MAIVCLLMALLSGCTARSGQFLYAMGFGKAPKIEAEFTLTDQPILIFVDDVHERFDWPQAEQHIFEELSQALLRNKAAHKIIPIETLSHVRQSMETFEKRGCREIGEQSGATQVLWLEVREFLADEQFSDASNAAFITVSVKVIDVTEKESRTRVRLWPPSPEGRVISANLSGAEVAEAKSKDEVSKKLAEELGDSVSKLFYEHRADDMRKKKM